MVLNLFIGVVVNAMQDINAAAEKDERDAERKMIEEETGPIFQEIQKLRTEMADMRAELGRSLPGSGSRP